MRTRLANLRRPRLSNYFTGYTNFKQAVIIITPPLEVNASPVY